MKPIPPCRASVPQYTDCHARRCAFWFDLSLHCARYRPLLFPPATFNMTFHVWRNFVQNPLLASLSLSHTHRLPSKSHLSFGETLMHVFFWSLFRGVFSPDPLRNAVILLGRWPSFLWGFFLVFLVVLFCVLNPVKANTRRLPNSQTRTLLLTNVLKTARPFHLYHYWRRLRNSPFSPYMNLPFRIQWNQSALFGPMSPVPLPQTHPSLAPETIPLHFPGFEILYFPI